MARKAKKLRGLKSIFTGVLAALMAVMFAASLCITIGILRVNREKNLNRTAEGEFAYIEMLMDRAAEYPDSAPVWLEGYHISDDAESFALIADDGVIVNATDGDSIAKDLETGFGLDADIQALEESGKPAWAKLEDGRQYYLFAREYDGWDIILGVSYGYIYANTPVIVAAVVYSCAALFAVLFIAISRLIDKKIIAGLENINESLEKITNGELDEKVDVRTSKEFAELSGGINTTVDSLKDAVKRAEAAAWMERELSIASEIQISAMPKLSNALRQDDRFELYADMKAAKEVGGDFYDFFVIGEDKLGFVIADVSGKGIPAAMFMMTAQTHIRLYMEQGADLASAFFEINEKLCENNEVEMFVTVFAGVLDVATGELRYINAGHNPAALLNGGKLEWMKARSGPLIGMVEGAEYKELSLPLQKGDLLYLYTDGVTEAANPNRELFGTARLEALLIKNEARTNIDIAQAVFKAIAAFEDGAERADDITMLLLRR